jgi:hypothetical protein
VLFVDGCHVVPSLCRHLVQRHQQSRT